MSTAERSYNESARDFALRVLKEKIVSMELQPGTKVSENELASQMGLSRTPVREALMELAKARIVEILPQRGCRIALIDYAFVEEARFVREVLEVSILPLICDSVTPAQLQKLRQNVRLQRLSQEPGMEDSVNLIELDNAFHHELYVIARKEQTFDLLRSLQLHFDRVRSLTDRVVHDSKVIDDHQRLVDAIAAHDVPLAQEIMAHHLRRVKLDQQTLLKTCPEFIKKDP